MPIADLAEICERMDVLAALDSSALEVREERDSLSVVLLERLEQLDKVLDAVPLALSVRDLSGRYVIANSAMPSNSGLDIEASAFLGKDFATLQPVGTSSACYGCC